MNGDRETTVDGGAERTRSMNRRGWLWVVLAVIAVVAIVGVAVAVNSQAGDAASPGVSTPTSSAAPDAAPDSGDADTEAGTGTAADDEPAPDRTADAPVALDEPAVVSDGITARVTAIEPVMGEAKLPGEISGPALRVTVEIANDTDASIDLTSTVITVYYGDDSLQASPVSLPEGTPLPRSVAATEKASGAFVFEVPESQRDRVRVEVDIAVTEPIVAFEGALA